MIRKPKKTHVPESLRPEGEERSKSTGRSNCTIFLDHPELFSKWDLARVKLPKNTDVPSCWRRLRKKRLG